MTSRDTDDVVSAIDSLDESLHDDLAALRKSLGRLELLLFGILTVVAVGLAFVVTALLP